MPRKKKETKPSAFAARVFEAERAGSVGSHPPPPEAEPALSTYEPDPEPPETLSPQAEPGGSGFGPLDIEELLYEKLGDDISNCQRAVCRVMQGKPIGSVADDPLVLATFDGVIPELDGPPFVLMNLSGVRTAKSTTISIAAVTIAREIDVPDFIRQGDEIRIPIVSTDVDTAKATFAHVVGTIQSSPRLRALLATDERGNPIEPKSDSLLIRNKGGRDIEIKVVALSRAGSTLTARWFASAIFDEAPRMGGEVDFVRSFDEAYRSCLGRVIDGGTIFLCGSPHARIGPIYDLFRKHRGKPTRRFVVAKAKAYWLNPVFWTPERCAEYRAEDPIGHQTDVEAEFRDPESALGDSASIEAAMRDGTGDVPYIEGHHYVATMDPATRVNAWTFTVVECIGHSGVSLKYRVALRKQWVPGPGRTLSPDAVFAEVARDCRSYKLTACHSDIAGSDFAVELAAQHGLDLIIETGVDLLELGRELMVLIKRSLFELPNDNAMREDLQSVRTRTSSNGGVSILLPKSSGGRHCDYFPSLCLAVKNLPEPPDEKEETTMQQRDLERELADFASRNDDTDGASAARRASGW